MSACQFFHVAGAAMYPREAKKSDNRKQFKRELALADVKLVRTPDADQKCDG